MIGGLILIFITTICSMILIRSLKVRHPFLQVDTLWSMYFIHVTMTVAYYLYAKFNPSDSIAYYQVVANDLKADSWWGHYGTGTTFIRFIGYPFIKMLGFSYEAMMVLFSFMGFVGFCFFFVFFKDRITASPKLFGLDVISIIFFLPNLHFWSTSFGKGSVILMGMGVFFYGLANIRYRLLAILLGGIIIYHVRPHIMLMVLVSAIIGFTFSSKGISLSVKLVGLVLGIAAFYFIYDDVLSLVGIDEEQFLTQGLSLSHRASELTKSTSGVDITSYNLPLQLFTFIYRPLFFDAPGLLGLFVSFENVFYLVLSLRLFSLQALGYLFRSDFVIKTCALTFITVSIALAQISGNLGLALRQKSQVMLLLLFIIVSVMNEREERGRRHKQRQMLRRRRMSELRVNANKMM